MLKAFGIVGKKTLLEWTRIIAQKLLDVCVSPRGLTLVFILVGCIL